MLERLSRLGAGTFFLTLLALLLAAYASYFGGDFIGDDIGRLEKLGQDFTLASMWQGGLGDRPVLGFSLWLDRAVLHLPAGAMRVESLLWLALALTLARAIVREFLARATTGQLELALMLFALHPLNSQVVAHLVQRGVLLALVASLAATLCLVRAKGDPRQPLWKVALLCWLLALLSKSNVVFFPLVWWAMFRRRSLWPFFLLTLVPWINYRWGAFNAQDQWAQASSLEYFLYQGKMLLHYFGLMLWPAGLRFNHDFQVPYGSPFWPGLLSWLALLGLWALAWWRALDKTPWAVLGFALLAFLPESSFFPINHPFFEHRAFIPLFFICLALGVWQPRLSDKWRLAVTLPVLVVMMAVTVNRGFGLKSFQLWAVRELSHTCQDKYLVVYLINELLERGMVESARQGEATVGRCATPPNTLPLASALIRLQSYSGFDHQTLAQLKAQLHPDFPTSDNIRRIVYAHLVRTAHQRLPPGEASCVQEDFFSSQLRYFRSFAANMAPEISLYAREAEACLSHRKAQGSRGDSFQELKIRTIKFAYFNIPDELLGRDLSAAVGGDELDYLRGLYRTYLEARSPSP